MDWLKSNCAFSSETMRSVSLIPLSADALEAFICSVPGTLIMTCATNGTGRVGRWKIKAALRAKGSVRCLLPESFHQRQEAVTRVGGHRGKAEVCLWFHYLIPLKFMR